MPQIGDILQVPIKFIDPDGKEVFNIYHFALDAIQTNTWQAVADDLALWFETGYDSWMGHVSATWNSDSFEIRVRDAANGQWDSVHTEDFQAISGTLPQDSAPALAVASFIQYPGLVRHWGFKNMPSPAEGSYSDGRISGTALADLVISGLLLSSQLLGANVTMRVGVYTLAEELFRGFTGTIAASNAIGSRVTRKVNRGV